MMRALQKRSDSHPTKGENRMKGRTMMAPQRIFQVSLRTVQPYAQGNQQELGPLFVEGVLRLDQHEPPEGTPRHLVNRSGGVGVMFHEIICLVPPFFWIQYGIPDQAGRPGKGRLSAELNFSPCCWQAGRAQGAASQGVISIRGL